MKVSTTKKRQSPSRGRLARIEMILKRIDKKLSMMVVEEIALPTTGVEQRFVPSVDYPAHYIPSKKEDFYKQSTHPGINNDIGTNTVKA